MPITTEQRELRRKYIGSSDAAAIMGLDPLRSPVDVYWSKTVDLPEEKKPAFDLGNRLEDVICEWAADRLAVQIERNVWRTHDDGIRAANLDAIVVGRPEAFEAKFSTEGGLWGEEGSDEVPERVLLQAQHQIAVAGLDRVWVPALLAGPFERPQFRLYCVNRHEELIEAITEQELAFWTEHVIPGVPPDGDSVPPLQVLKTLRRTTDVVDLDDEAAADWLTLERAREAVTKAEKAKDMAMKAVIGRLGQAEAGRLPDGTLLTYFEQRGADRVDRAQLRACHPDIYATFFTEMKYRVLRSKPPKAQQQTA